MPGRFVGCYTLAWESEIFSALLGISGMSGSAEQQGAHADVDHRLECVAAVLVMAHQPSPACHPTERALRHPPAWQGVEALLPD